MTETVKFSCTICHNPLVAEPNDIGNLTECPSCHNKIKVPPFGVVPGMKFGDFTVKKLLGLGGMGEVWLAYQESMQRQVALKVLSPELAGDQNFVRRFMQEVKIAGKLTHPNIVMAYQAGEQDRIKYLAISYIDGKVLGDILTEDEPLTEHQALGIIRDIAKALKYAWEKFHILHRDIKPDNIMISSDGTPMLMDMGISKITDANESLTLTGTILGTPNYISPEQARAEVDIDTRADQYSLGATLFHLVTGKLPYTATSAMGILAQHLQEPVPDVKDVNPVISDQCQALIKKMMAKKKEDRFNSWDEVIAVCDQLLPSTGQSTEVLLSVHSSAKSKAKIYKYIVAALIVFLLFAVFVLAKKLKESRKGNRSNPDNLPVSERLSDNTGSSIKSGENPIKVTQFTNDDDKKLNPLKNEKNKNFKRTQHEERLKAKLKEKLDIEGEKLDRLVALMVNFHKKMTEDIYPKTAETEYEKRARFRKFRSAKQQMINEAEKILSEDELFAFKKFIDKPPKGPRNRFNDRLKRR